MGIWSVIDPMIMQCKIWDLQLFLIPQKQPARKQPSMKTSSQIEFLVFKKMIVIQTIQVFSPNIKDRIKYPLQYLV